MEIWNVFKIGFILCVSGVILASSFFSSQSPKNHEESFILVSIIIYPILITFISGMNSIYLSYIKYSDHQKFLFIAASLLPIFILESLIWIEDSLVSLLSSFFVLPVLLTNIIWIWRNLKSN